MERHESSVAIEATQFEWTVLANIMQRASTQLRMSEEDWKVCNDFVNVAFRSTPGPHTINGQSEAAANFIRDSRA